MADRLRAAPVLLTRDADLRGSVAPELERRVRASARQQLHVAVVRAVRHALARPGGVPGRRHPRGGSPPRLVLQQWSEVVTYGTDDRGASDPLALSAAVSAALTSPMPRPADQSWRRERAAAVARVHRDVYAQVAGDRSRVP